MSEVDPRDVNHDGVRHGTMTRKRLVNLILLSVMIWGFIILGLVAYHAAS